MPKSKLLLADTSIMVESDLPDIKLWASLYNDQAITYQSLVDRTGRIQMPYDIGLHEKFKMPTDLTGFNMGYEELCNAQAQRLLDLSERLNVPIYVMYSGGIDSTMMLISFIKQATTAQKKNNLVVALSPDSITENPNFYYKHIRPHLRIKSSEENTSWFDKTKIIVGGEHNDQLLGTDVPSKINETIPFDLVMQPHTNRILVEYFKVKKMSDEHANWWYDLLAWHATHAPCEIKSTFDLLWWFNFCFKWQTVFLRMLLRVDPPQKPNIDQEFCNTYYHHFFGHEDFQKWSMLNPHLKIKNDWNTYKFHVKDTIYKFTEDKDYWINKTKRASLYKLFLQKPVAKAITEDWQFLDTFSAEDYYVPENSFSKGYR